jgi:hypothetical protein
MSYVNYNANPSNNRTGDCTVRAISTLLDSDWDDVYFQLCILGFTYKLMPSTNAVWGELLNRNGFRRYIIPNLCPACYTVREFCKDNPKGKFLLATSGHVIAVINGNYYDTSDSGNEVPIYYWAKEE